MRKNRKMTSTNPSAHNCLLDTLKRDASSAARSQVPDTLVAVEIEHVVVDPVCPTTSRIF
jgi:hypothetical protein